MSAKKADNPESDPSREILLDRVFAAPRELVWDAMTDPRQLVQWWGPRGFTTTIEVMDVRPGGAWNLVMHGPDGVDYPNYSTFLEMTEPARLVFSHGGSRPGGPAADFVGTWTFDTVAPGQTRVTIRMVFPTAAARDQVVKEYGAIEGGRQTLARLGELLARPPAADEPCFHLARIFDAPRERVWQAWTDPRQMARWWGPKLFSTPICEMDVRPGGSYRLVMRSPEGVDYPLTGVFREVAAPERLVLTMDPSGHPSSWHDLVNPGRSSADRNPAGILLTTATFEDLGGKTRLTIRTRFESAQIRDAMLGMGMTEGWSESLDRLGAIVSG